LFFLQNVLKVEFQAANIMVAVALLIGTGFFVVFGWLSDKIGRKPIIMAGLLLAMLTYFPLFKAMTWTANPALAQAQATVRATVTADPADCRFQFNPTGTSKFTSSCDVATAFLTKNSVPYDIVPAPSGTPATVKIGNETVPSYDVVAAGDKAKSLNGAFEKGINVALHDGGYPLVRGIAKIPDAKLAPSSPPIGTQPHADAVRAGEKATVPVDKLVADKLLTKEETNGLTEMPVYSIAKGGTFAMVADPAAVNWVGRLPY